MIIEPQFRTKFGDNLWSDKERISRMLAFERCLANGQADVGIIPSESATAINSVEWDTAGTFTHIFEQSKTSGNLAIPFVESLKLSLASQHPFAVPHVHFGATSQDLLDTSMMLALAAAFDQIYSNLLDIENLLTDLSERHKSTPMIGRTLHQQAAPITFGLKAAKWAMAIHEAAQKTKRTRYETLAVQLGGPAGTLTSMQPHGTQIRGFLATQLNLSDPGYCWHADRSRILTACAAMAQAAGILAKISNDCLLMMQNELDEIREGKPGGSSSMPHKQNPVCTLIPLSVLPIISAHLSTIASLQGHPQERSAGEWHAEWIIIPSISSLTLSAIEQTHLLLSELQVNDGQMAKNLENTKGSLATSELKNLLLSTISAKRSTELVAMLLEKDNTEGFSIAALANSELVTAVGKEELQTLFSYRNHLKESEQETDRILNEIKTIS